MAKHFLPCLQGLAFEGRVFGSPKVMLANLKDGSRLVTGVLQIVMTC